MNDNTYFLGIPAEINKPHYIYRDGCGTGPIGKIPAETMKHIYKISRNKIKKLHYKQKKTGGFLGTLAAIAGPLLGSFASGLFHLIGKKHHKTGSGRVMLVSKDKTSRIDLGKHIHNYKKNTPRDIRQKLSIIKKMKIGSPKETHRSKNTLKNRHGGAIGFGLDSQVIYQ